MSSESANRRFLTAGEIFHGSSGACSVVLGSGVSVVIYDQRLRRGGMNHILLSDSTRASEAIRESGVEGPGLGAGTFADVAIPQLLKEFKRMGSRPQDLVAWIFGGTAEFRLEKSFLGSETGSGFSLGEENTSRVRALLKKYSIPLQAEHVGGSQGRWIELDLDSGYLRCQVLRERIPRRIHNVMIVDDSGPVRKILRSLFEQDPGLHVVGDFSDCRTAEEFLVKEVGGLNEGVNRVDVVSLDLQMPSEDGISFFRRCLRHREIPAILVTDLSLQTSSDVLQGLGEGILDYFQKPSLKDFEYVREDLCKRIKLAAELGALGKAKTIEFRLPSTKGPSEKTAQGSGGLARKLSSIATRRTHLIVIGSSTGGTEALKTVLGGLQPPHPPIVIVQHMPKAFTRPFSESLRKLTGMIVTEVTDVTKVEATHVYIAGGGRHIRAQVRDQKLVLVPSDEAPVSGFRPSVDYFFSSLASHPEYARGCFALLLTGMGHDGAEGMLQLQNQGAYTITQHSSDCLVYGMPKVAFDKGASMAQLRLPEIHDLLAELKFDSRLKAA